MSPSEIYAAYEGLSQSGKTAHEIVADLRSHGVEREEILAAFNEAFGDATSADQAEEIDLKRAGVLHVVEQGAAPAKQ